MTEYTTGQRWISESEPELGLGALVEATPGLVKILFPAAGETRQYARDNAPLKRVRFRPGDTIETQEERSLVVRSVREENGLLIYLGPDCEVPETRLNDRISFHRPEDRLLSGHLDEEEAFELRRRTLRNQFHRRRSPVRGFVGGRIDLIPHQLYIAHEVSSRAVPRVLLSDEVGLGKTIEACLILHRLLQSGRAGRALVLVPESLVHQWFVEMLRRFNTWLHIFDEERCRSIEAGQKGANPFLDDQLILCSMDFLARSETRTGQALAAGWDMLVVDEAHHLQWSPTGANPDYRVVEALSRQSEGLLLLTATPEQLGELSHFARLRLLDPDRFTDFESFQKEAKDYRPLARIAQKLQKEETLTLKETSYLKTHFPREKKEIDQRLKSMARGEPTARLELLEDLLDLHGPGRVVFRNTRSAMTGFPKRRLHLAPIQAKSGRQDWIDQLSTEFAVDAGDEALAARQQYEMENDPRVVWLADLLRELAPKKVLLICRSPEKVLALDQALKRHIQVKAGIFHEGLTLVQRDRNAAWFAGEEDVQLLICSEIGSEGRNFQFAHHLVLFDLPLNPELLEQRIGRLDRIGQAKDIQIHVPYLQGSPQEVLVRWYQEGLDAFETSLEGGSQLLVEFGRQVHDLALEYPEAAPREARRELADLLTRTARLRKKLRKQLEEGRDRLLEMNSFRPLPARQLVEEITREDRDTCLEEYMLDVFEHFGVHAEELGSRTYQLNPRGVTTAAFPAIPEEGLIATFERKHALGREEVAFLSWDHPMVTGAMDLVLDSEKGNSCFAVWPSPQERTLLLECLLVLETVASPKLHVDRFLPATPIRVVINHKKQEVTEACPEDVLRSTLQKGLPYKLLEAPHIKQKVLPAMVEEALQAAQNQSQAIVKRCLGDMTRMLAHEIQRLQTLSAINDHVHPQEIESLKTQQAGLTEAMEQARVRLDGVRLIWKGDPGALG